MNKAKGVPRARCRECVKVTDPEAKERVRARSAAWRAQDPERFIASMRASYAKHREKRRESRRERDSTQEAKAVRRAYVEANRHIYRQSQARQEAKRTPERWAEVRAYLSAWNKANTDKTKVYRNRRRARKVEAGGTHTAEDIAEIRRLQRDRCANPACRVPLRGGGHADHIVALARGGSNDRSNIQVLCQPCNNRKHAKDPIAFMQEQGFLL